MKNKMNIKRRILSLCLACLMVLEVMVGNEIALADSPFTWTNTPTISLANNSYYKMNDITTYGLNYTCGYGINGTHYNTLYGVSDNRITYFKKVPATVGQKLTFITSDADIASGSANTVSGKRLYYSLSEYDANGNCLYDTPWYSLGSTWTAGQSTGGTGNSGTRSNVAYIIFIFKLADGNTASDGQGSAITAQQIVNETKNLYIAKGSLNYTLSYNANGGSVSPASKTITYGSTYGSLPTPTRAGYTFNGWYTAASGGSKISTSTAMNRAANHTIYAQWSANKYTVTYNANGGSGTTAASSHTYGTAKNLTANGFKRTGYTFNGWNTKTDGTGTWYSNQQSVNNLTTTNGGSINLYAQWTHNIYTVTYDANGGSTTNTTKNYYYADSVDLSPVAEKSGKIFIGWSTNPNATKAMESYAMPDGSVTLYAIYSIPVSDVANHTYPAYEQVKEEEVYFRVWEVGNESNIRVYPLEYIRDTITMKYHYVLPTTDVSDFVGGMTEYGYEILAFDNAGNYTSLYKNSYLAPPPPAKYWQTVIHYIYDQDLNGWASFLETAEEVLEGVIYTPAFATPPAGYSQSHIDGEYLVDGPRTSSAYYVPIDYILSFDPNGGTCDVTEKTITFNDYYGTMPTPYKEGYEFLGWYTEADGGTQVLSSHKYLTSDNTTIYAHWKVMEFPVTYDYRTNGGTSTDVESATIEYATAIDLSVKAYKDGWEFVGWNTDSTATTGLTSMNMPAHPVTLYAIYKKDITLTIVEQTDNGQVTREQTKTIYNTEKEAVFPMEEVNTWTGWTFLGWTDGTLATDYPIVGIGNDYKLGESDTLCGAYTSTVTVSYDTNGSSMVIEDLSKECFYNASGDAFYPEFIIADEPVLSQHSFVEWRDEDGIRYMPDEVHVFTKNVLLTAIWNKYPEIEAYDRYFTMEQAKKGDITEAELLKKVTATDLEDGTLVNGVDVIVKDYNSEDFTSLEADKEIEITYQATDSFGNAVTRTITANVTDTTVRKSTKRKYVRFISEEFFTDSDGELLSSDLGGVEETSVWRQDPNYAALLQNTLSNKKLNVETKTLSAFGGEWEVEVASSGARSTKEETWTFTREDINVMKNYTKTHGHVLNAIDEFWELFDKCRQEG